MKKLSFTKIIIPLALLALFFILYSLIAILPENDLKAHAHIASEMIENHALFQGNFILYLLTILLSFFNPNESNLLSTLCFLLSSATLFRFLLAQNKFYHIRLYPDSNRKNYWLSFIIALSLIFVFAIPFPTLFKHGFMYIGTFTPNVWHNSTIIFLFPFALLLFSESCKQIEIYSPKRNYLLSALIVLNIFIKPSFFFVFACIYPLIMLYRYKFSKSFWASIFPLIIGCICLTLEYLSIYNADNELYGNLKSSISICFLAVFRLQNSIYELPFSILFSLLFPIVYTVLNYKKLRTNIIYWYTISLTFIALVIYLTFVEEGPRFAHGNFYWQIVICAWLYFYISLLNLVKDIKTERFILKNKILLSLYSFQVIIGIVYLINILTNKSYY